ncbi:MAG: DUF1266 domain-containing protein [Pontixanthobacter sp.]
MIGAPKIRLSDTPIANPARAFAYALGAMFHVTARLPVDALPPGEGFGPKILARDWGITDTDTLVAQLNQLGFAGHRQDHVERVRYYTMMFRPAVAARREELRDIIRESGDRAEAASQDLWLLNAVQADMPGLRSAPLLAFDAGRAVMLTREGLCNGWLQDDAAWAYLLDLAREVQATFGSWEEYGADFLLGRKVWKGQDSAELFDRVIPDLLSAPNSPWVRLPWGVPDLTIPGPVATAAKGAPNWSLEEPAWILPSLRTP